MRLEPRLSLSLSGGSLEVVAVRVLVVVYLQAMVSLVM